MKKILITFFVLALSVFAFAWDNPVSSVLEDRIINGMVVNSSYYSSFQVGRSSSNAFLIVANRPTWLLLRMQSALGFRMQIMKANNFTSNEKITAQSNVKSATWITNFNLYPRTNRFNCPVFQLNIRPDLSAPHNARTNITLGYWRFDAGEQFMPYRFLMESNKKYIVRIFNEYTPKYQGVAVFRNGTNFTTMLSNTAQTYSLQFMTWPK